MTAQDTIVALSSGAGKAGVAVIRASGPRRRRLHPASGGQGMCRRSPGGSARAPRCRGGRRGRRGRPGVGAVAAGAGLGYGRGCRGIPGSRQPGGCRQAAVNPLRSGGSPAGRGGRIHAPRLRERQDGPVRSRRPGGPDRRRDRGAAGSGATADGGRIRGPLCSVGHAIAPQPRLARGGDRFSR